MSVPTFEPHAIIVGETLAWSKSLLDYKASDGWALTYNFRGAGAGFDVAATADGDSFQIIVAATTTGTMAQGVYYWQAWVTRGSEKYLVAEGQAPVRHSLASIATSDVVDDRSQIKKILDAIDALIAGRLIDDVDQYMIGTRQLKHIPVEQLISLRTKYAQLYAQERRRDALKDGAPYFKNIYTRFQRPQ